MLMTSQQDKPPAERPGSSTSEFKLTLLSVAAGLALVLTGTLVESSHSDRLIDAGMWVMLGSLPSYVLARTYLKSKTMQ